MGLRVNTSKQYGKASLDPNTIAYPNLYEAVYSSKNSRRVVSDWTLTRDLVRRSTLDYGHIAGTDIIDLKGE